MHKKVGIVSTIIFSFILNTLSAQEKPVSMLDEVSYVYMEKLIAVAKENYPRLKIHNSKINIAEASVNSAKFSWLSPLSLSYVYSPTNTLNLTNPTFFSGYQIGFSLNLGTLLQTPFMVKQAKEELKVSKYDMDEYLLTLTTEVKRRYFTYLQALKVLKLNSQSNLDAQNSFTRIKYKYEKGEVAFEEYNNAAILYATSNKSKLDSEVSLLIAKASLEELLGIRVEEVPN